jgi:hypothetical protein
MAEVDDLAHAIMRETGMNEAAAYMSARARLGLPIGDVVEVDTRTGKRTISEGKIFVQDDSGRWVEYGDDEAEDDE